MALWLGLGLLSVVILESDFLSVRRGWLMREIFMESNDSFLFFDKFVEVNGYRSDINLLDFHRFEAVFHRLKGW